MSQTQTSTVKKPVRQGQFISIRDKAARNLQKSLDYTQGCGGVCPGGCKG